MLQCTGNLRSSSPRDHVIPNGGTFAAVDLVDYRFILGCRIIELHLLTVAVVPKSPGFAPTLIASVLLSGHCRKQTTVCSCPSNSCISSILLLFLLSFFLLADLPFLPLSGRWFQTCISMSISTWNDDTTLVILFREATSTANISWLVLFVSICF